jgi:REP element-mobilizing transposase RayT
MILGFHFIFSAYGFWLPNDPRGSWSDTVRSFDLLRFGPATKTDVTRSLAHQPHDHRLRLAAKQALRYPPVQFTGEQARAIARRFAEASMEGGYTIHALAILPDHAHLVMRYCRRHIDKIAAHLKAKATMSLTRENLHPMARFVSAAGRKPSPWARNYWCPFIRSRSQMEAAIEYVENNPAKAGLRAQRWRCVAPYEG